MHPLSAILDEMQRLATALPTAELRDHIQACLDVLSEDIDAVHCIGPSATDDQVSTATDNVTIAALATAVYVRELTNRPLNRHFAKVRFSFN